MTQTIEVILDRLNNGDLKHIKQPFYVCPIEIKEGFTIETFEKVSGVWICLYKGDAINI